MQPLEPGRELNARIARILGCNPELRKPPRYGYAYYHCPCTNGRHNKAELVDDILQEYSTSLAAAMGQPWEWLKARHANVSLHSIEDTYHFIDCYQPRLSPHYQATEALAICAAVIAIAETSDH